MTYSHFTLDERIELQGCLGKSMACQEAAWRLDKDPTSVSREVKRNRISEGFKYGYGKPSMRCSLFGECDVESLCMDCSGKPCRTCKKQDCTLLCSEHDEVTCAKTSRWPHVCNGCRKKASCKLERFKYSAKIADAKARDAASEPRRGVDLTGAQLADLDALLTPLMKQGQSLSQIYMAHAEEIPCSLKSLYTHVNKGEVGAGRMYEIDAVRRKPRKRTAPKPGPAVPRASLVGRSYDDFLALPGDVRDSRWEMDTVIGRVGGKCLLTLLHRLTRFQLALLLASCCGAEVARALDMLSALPHSPFAAGRRALVLTDNGHEFHDAGAIEAHGRIRLYYCQAYSSWQKGACECGHRLYRRIAPKGTSFDGFTDLDCQLMMSHANSTPREALGGISPIEAVVPFVGLEFLAALGVELVDRDDVVLKPELLDYRK